MNKLGIGSINAQARTYELVLEQLREAIVNGTIQQGTVLRTAELAQEMGVSRMPVREALHRLEAEGLVTMQPYRGAIITPLSTDKVTDAYELLSVIEAMSARKAAEVINEEQLAELDELLDEMDEVRRSGDTTAYSKYNRQFHSLVYVHYHNERAHEIMSDLWNYVYRLRRMYPQAPERMEQGMQQHRDLVQALRVHDPVKVERIVRTHVEQSLEKLLIKIENNPDDGVISSGK
jgi:DNA-binding GntR family transcriptional regulator